ncbi:MAG: bifunctional hydroxymethylpyrimidine kinase/phosphomethylpyrimidine kinase [Proteobacteria bacterium]|nr:bifunctional hydroxymethylpyrimidine kinase/phosphomethylpyrimidine kinase [Pseudomonadota bacterium]
MSTVLVIAGSDSSGGAGIARDLQTLHEHRVHGVYALTAVTAQTDARVLASYLVPASTVRAQIDAAFESGPVQAVKIGMLGSEEIVLTVAEALQRYPAAPVVLDPVLASTSGAALLDQPGLRALREVLLPLVHLLTPNIPEAALLLGTEPADDAAILQAQAQALRARGPRAVLLKGGHGAGADSVDFLALADGVRALRSARLAGSRRGTGCALASSIAASVARGLTLEAACRQAKDYVTALLRT